MFCFASLRTFRDYSVVTETSTNLSGRLWNVSVSVKEVLFTVLGMTFSCLKSDWLRKQSQVSPVQSFDATWRAYTRETLLSWCKCERPHLRNRLRCRSAPPISTREKSSVSVSRWSCYFQSNLLLHSYSRLRVYCIFEQIVQTRFGP